MTLELVYMNMQSYQVATAASCIEYLEYNTILSRCVGGSKEKPGL